MKPYVKPLNKSNWQQSTWNSTIGYLITTQAALTYGQPWLEELKTVFETNIDL